MHQQTRKGLLMLALSTLSLSSLHAANFVKAMAADGTVVDAVPQQVVVSYKKGFEKSGRASMQRMSTQIRRSSGLQQLGFETLRVPAGETIDSFIQKLKADPNIETAEPNVIMRAFAVAPNDPGFPDQEGYYLGGSTIGINILNAWDISQGTPSVIIAVLDTGVDLTHTDLAANILPGATMENDLDGDGDCTGTNEECANTNPTDVNGHGTHVTGLIAAVTNNNLGIAGIARNCKILPIRVLTANGRGADTAVAEGIVYAINHGASIINMSLGSDTSSSVIESAVNEAINNNVVVVAAAGNNETTAPTCPVKSPASIDRVIAVGATDTESEIADFSCIGSQVDLVAPGVHILSTKNGGGTSYFVNGNTNFPANGTSFAAPMVSGVAALIRTVAPTMPVADVARYLDFYADDIGPNGFDTNYGFGRLNAYRTLQAVTANDGFVSHPVYPEETFPYPNPFNPTEGGLVTVSLPETMGTSGIKITIFSTTGLPIKTLHETNSWDGKNDDGNYVASGLYYYFAETNQGHVKGKLTVIK